MKRNSTTLFLESQNATTLVPWNDGTPDFSAFEEPTLSVLRDSWTNFINDGGIAEYAEELEPTEVIELVAPNYPAFNVYMLTNSANIAYEVSLNSINPKLSQAVTLAYNNIVDRGLEDFAQIFPIFCSTANVSQSHREEWALAAVSYNLPQQFVSILRGEDN